MLDDVEDEALTGEATAFAEWVSTIKGAVARSVGNGQVDLSQLHGESLDQAVAGILDADGLGRRHPRMMVTGVQEVARLQYARHLASEFHPAPYLWSAAALFRIIRPMVRLPDEVALLLDVLDADDPAEVPGLDDLAAAADMATCLTEYALVEHDTEALTRAETLISHVVDLSPPYDPHLPTYLNSLVVILVSQLECTSVSVVARVKERILALVERVDQPRHRLEPSWQLVRAGAGGACYALSVRMEDPALLERSISLLRSATGVMPDDTPGKAGFLQNLGRAELTSWIWREEQGRPEDSVTHLARAIELTADGDPHAADRHTWFAMALLAAAPADPAGAARSLQSADARAASPGIRVDTRLLGEAWLLLWQVRPDDGASLERAIDLLSLPMAVPASSGPWAERDGLAEALWRRWEKTRDIADVNQVIARLSARADKPDAPALVLNLLARALRARWERTGDSVAIQHAITCLAGAVTRCSVDDPAASMYLNNLSAMCLRLHHATGSPAALQYAVVCAQLALTICTDADLGRPMYANNAALAMLELANLASSDKAWTQAIEMSRAALSMTPDDHPDKASHTANLGVALAHAAARTADVAMLDLAVETLESAMQMLPASHPAYGSIVMNLGESLLSCGRASDDHSKVRHGRDLLRQSAGLTYLRHEAPVHAARRWGEEAAVAGEWDSAAVAMRQAVERLAGLPGHRLERSDHEELLVRLAGLATDAAAACRAANDINGAVESLELGRGVLLARVLCNDHVLAALQKRDPVLAARVANAEAALAGESEVSLGQTDSVST